MSRMDYWVVREELVIVLENDCKENFARLQADSSDLNRRNYIRSLFALYEAILSNLRETIAAKILNRKTFYGDLDLHEVYPLMDETAFIGENGKINKRPNQAAFKSLVKYVLKLACIEYKIDENIFTDGWDDFVASIQLRHKITHPKYEKDISINDEELEIIERGRLWWNNALGIIRTKGVV